MQQYDITVPANAPFRIGAAGRYIKYVLGSNGGGDVSLLVTPGMQSGNKITLLPGQAYRVADDQPIPDSWLVANAAGGNAIVGTLVIGNGRIDDNSIAGTVQIVDGGKARTLAGNAFMLNVSQSAVAGNESVVQLWNAVGSGKRLCVESLGVQCTSSAAQIGFGHASVVLGTFVAGGVSKLTGGAVSVAGKGWKAAQATSGATAQLGVMGVAASQTVEKKFSEPVVILPGNGLNVWNGNLNLDLWATFEWYEEPNV
jgi:hypothetical protein